MKITLLALTGILSLFMTACGRLAKSDSPSMPAPCVNSVCQLQVEGYPQEVAVLIPPYADFKNITMFFHGFSTGKERDKNLAAVMADLDIVKSFRDSNTNRVLIVPFSSGQNKDYKQFLKNKTDLRNFINSVYKAFAMKVQTESVQLIAHSRAFQTVQDLVGDQSEENKNLHISQVTLLDATYSKFNSRTFMYWLRSGDNKMSVIYLKNSPTEKKALELWGLFSGQKPGPVGGFTLDNGDFLTLIPETEVRNQPDAHWALARKWFGRSLLP